MAQHATKECDDMWSVDMQHFLDDKGSTDRIPLPAKELADHFGAIVAAVTLDFTGRANKVAEVTCRNAESPCCTGTIIGYLGQDLGQIEWNCNECNDYGVITGWEDTLWDCCEQALAGL